MFKHPFGSVGVIANEVKQSTICDIERLVEVGVNSNPALFRVE